MKKSLNIELTAALRSFIDERTDGSGIYSTPSEYVRDLIRKDMEGHAVYQHVMRGVADLKGGKFSTKSILDIDDED